MIQQPSLKSPFFDIQKFKQEVEKLCNQAEKSYYEEFLKNPSTKNFKDFLQFIELSSANDPLPQVNQPNSNKNNFSSIDSRLIESFVIKHGALNDLVYKTANDNFSSELQRYSLEDLEKKGKCLTGLFLNQIRQGARGQYLFYMIDPSNNIQRVKEKLESNKLQVDDKVCFCITNYSPVFHAYGSIYKFLDNGVVVSLLSSDMPEYGKKYALVLHDYHASFDVNYKTLEKVKFISQAPGDRRELLEDLIRSNLYDKEREATDLSMYENLEFVDRELNHDQKHAVKAALAAKTLYLIDGPAGTGKTRVISEFLHQCVKRGLKVLACAPNHVAVDNIVERLLSRNIKCCRIGRSGSCAPLVDSISLDKLIHRNRSVKFIDKECDKILELFMSSNNPKEKKALQSNVETIKGISSTYQQNIAKSIIYYSDIVLCTLAGAGSSILEQNNLIFDVAVIDECSQATELASWAAILRAKKVVIAGDRLQLPPYINNKEAEQLGIGYTLFDRLRTGLPRNLRQVLRVQYRMNELIMEWSNREFYKGKQIANDVCAQYTLEEYLKENSPVKVNKEKIPVIMIIDTAKSKANLQLNEKSQGNSYLNVGEGAIVLSLIDLLMQNYKLKPEHIGVISPYEAQFELIAKGIDVQPFLRGIKCHSVDQFQGKEKEVIIISLVRSNNDKKVGFLDNSKRMNVSVTRAKRFVAIVCDSSTICKPELPFLIDLVHYFKRNGDVKAPEDFKKVYEYQDLLLKIMESEAKRMKLNLHFKPNIPDHLKDNNGEEEKKPQEPEDNLEAVGPKNAERNKKIGENTNKKEVEEIKVDAQANISQNRNDKNQKESQEKLKTEENKMGPWLEEKKKNINPNPKPHQDVSSSEKNQKKSQPVEEWIEIPEKKKVEKYVSAKKSNNSRFEQKGKNNAYVKAPYSAASGKNQKIDGFEVKESDFPRLY